MSDGVFSDAWGSPGFIWGGAMTAEDSGSHIARRDDSNLTLCGLNIIARVRGPKNATCSECRRIHLDLRASDPEK